MYNLFIRYASRSGPRLEVGIHILSVKDKIRAIPRQLFWRGEDTIMWKNSRDGEFFTKSAYVLANNPRNLILPSRDNGFGS